MDTMPDKGRGRVRGGHPTGVRSALCGVLLLCCALLTGCSDDGDGTPDATASPATSPARGASPSAAGTASPGASAAVELPDALTGQRLSWGGCAARGGYPAPGGDWRCAKLKVPVDYARASGPTMDIALIRSRASGDGKRLGSLLFNFGGPGGSGVELMPLFERQYAAPHRQYDLVSFDPRGVGASSGVDCRSDARTAAAEKGIDLTPDTAAERTAYFADAADFGKGCAKDSGPLLPRLTTADTARDMDLLRQVLGDRKLSYFGVSYGTELGGTYAHLFPRRVGRMVLDAVVDPSADTMGHAKNQTLGFQRALDNYLKSTGQDPEKGTARIAALLKRLDAKPLPGEGKRQLNESLALVGIVSTLYSEQSWPELTRGLAQAEKEGDGSTLLSLADSYNDRDASGHYSTQAHAQRAISCADDSTRPSPAQAEAALGAFRKLSPVFGPFLGWDTAGWCHDWPVAGERKTPEVAAEGAAPVLVVGNTGDPATPYEGARRMADELGKGVGVELTWEGEGHGAYGSGSGCVDGVVDAYLLKGSVPRDGKRCG